MQRVNLRRAVKEKMKDRLVGRFEMIIIMEIERRMRRGEKLDEIAEDYSKRMEDLIELAKNAEKEDEVFEENTQDNN